METFSVNFFLAGQVKQLAFRRMAAPPRKGDICIFNKQQYLVWSVTWCMDEDATNDGSQRLNLELEKM
ncbi:hypothetical protein [Ferrimonas aestuarii]|uniref:Uncharacterized protein n=1 Tax=Ferrimonas aestuarii TaxID=2569539 RepID=A0A4U1BLB3_9GAMM|nr:hypothetical protein [Ferrimonas aestuarii]TKB53318.1 hypothetical protein FCL42_14715 [Ferrimonas aestuarii]